MQQLGPAADIVELGGGSGAFAEVALKKLLALDALPARYAILEPSADLRERQRERLRAHLSPLLFELVEWLDAPPHDAWAGVLFANEVIDALPTPRFTLRDGEVFEEHVALDGEGRFIRTDRPACRDDLFLDAHAQAFAVSEGVGVGFGDAVAFRRCGHGRRLRQQCGEG